jgi:hypothetical protein
MKNLRKFKVSISLILMTAFIISCNSYAASDTNRSATKTFTSTPLPLPPVTTNKNTIKIALLLDTSGSMNGLLEQAKSQLWTIVNELAFAKKDNVNAQLEIALYQYGNDGLNGSEGYIENVLPLSSDLDELSEKLFALSTNGGSEYCGHVIQTATNQLDWNTNTTDLNLIFIAGNESFTQGSINYTKACSNALSNQITINTIFCGDYTQGIQSQWQKGAKLTEGTYMNIDMNQKTIYVETPYDDAIANLNTKLNATYISYGSNGQSKKIMQSSQDYNSSSYSKSNMVNRTVSKSNHLYSNSSWDLVDASKNKEFNIEKVETNTLPTEMQSMTAIEKEAYIEKKTKERTAITSEINRLNIKRLAYIKTQSDNPNSTSLDNVMISAIKKQAIAKGYNFETTSLDISYTKANVDFDYFETVTAEAKTHRLSRLVNYETFLEYSYESNTIILDTRSKMRYDKMHIKGAIHINFSDFTQDYLAEMIPDKNTRILIYCNNNFAQDNPLIIQNFATKVIIPTSFKSIDTGQINLIPESKTLALNIPTYINLFGYGYQNVYELNELVSSSRPDLQLEGTDVIK